MGSEKEETKFKLKKTSKKLKKGVKIPSERVFVKNKDNIV